MITQARAGATVYHDGVYPDVFTEMGINQRTTPAAPLYILALLITFVNRGEITAAARPERRAMQYTPNGTHA